MVVTTRDPNEFAQDLFDGLPRRYDALAEVLSLRSERAVATPRWCGTSSSRAPQLDPRRRNGHGGSGARARATHTGAGDRASTSRTRCSAAGGSASCAPGATERVRLVAGQAERLPFPDATFDALTFTYLLRYVADPAATLRELARVSSSRAADREPRVRGAGQPVLARRGGGGTRVSCCRSPAS